MRQLKFSKNWNGKLNNRMFTTIRELSQYNDETLNIGDNIEIMFKEQLIGVGEIIDKTTVSFGIVPKYILQCDTGYLIHEAKQVFSTFLKTPINILDKRQVIVLLIKVSNRKTFIPYDND